VKKAQLLVVLSAKGPQKKGGGPNTQPVHPKKVIGTGAKEIPALFANSRELLRHEGALKGKTQLSPGIKPGVEKMKKGGCCIREKREGERSDGSMALLEGKLLLE